MLVPQQHGAATAAAQDLLSRPQAIRAAWIAAHPDQLRGRHAQRRHRQRLRNLRRLHQHHWPLHARQRRLQQAHLPDSRLRQQQLIQRAQRPAAARQLGGQGSMPRVHTAGSRARQLRCKPKRWVQGFRRWNRIGAGHGSGIKYCTYIQYSVPPDFARFTCQVLTDEPVSTLVPDPKVDTGSAVSAHC